MSRAYVGERIFGSRVPIGGEDMYILGSSGKSMTSTMAARVVAKGYISWKTTTKEIFHDTGLFDVHPSFQNSTLESFVSHGSGAPGLDVVVASTMTWWITSSTRPAGSQDLTTDQPVSTFLKQF